MGFSDWFGGGRSASGGTADAPAKTGPFRDGATLIPGQSWRSPNGRTVLTLDRGGLLSLAIEGKSVWKAPVKQRAAKLLFDHRGVLSLFALDSHRLWSAGTVGQPRAELHLQDDGNMVIYDGHKPLWDLGTHV